MCCLVTSSVNHHASHFWPPVRSHKPLHSWYHPLYVTFSLKNSLYLTKPKHLSLLHLLGVSLELYLMALKLISADIYETSISGYPVNEPARVCAEGFTAQDFHYWSGKSGDRYLHTVYSLFDCPQLPEANYILVKRLDDGSRIPLKIGQIVENSESLNLAFLRYHSACLGATEIHIHMLADADAQRDMIEKDLIAETHNAMVSEVRATVANH